MWLQLLLVQSSVLHRLLAAASFQAACLPSHQEFCTQSTPTARFAMSHLPKAVLYGWATEVCLSCPFGSAYYNVAECVLSLVCDSVLQLRA